MTYDTFLVRTKASIILQKYKPFSGRYTKVEIFKKLERLIINKLHRFAKKANYWNS